MKTALVIGASGFVARHTIPLLEAKGYRVERVDTVLGESIEEWLQSGRWLTHKPFDVVIHLAAQIDSIADRATSGIRAFEDIATDLCVARYLEERPPRECAVWMSSCATDVAMDPDGDPYALTKFVGQRLACTLHKKGVPVIILKPYSGFGPGQTLRYPVPAIFDRCTGNQNPLKVWGNLETVRDWVFIDDLARAILHGIEHFPRGVVVPIGTGKGTTLGQVAAECAQIIGYKPCIEADHSKPASSPSRIADTSIAERYGFKTTITVEEGLRLYAEKVYGLKTHGVL